MTDETTARDALTAMHRYLYPERYGADELYEWTPETIEDIAHQLEDHMRAAGLDVPAEPADALAMPWTSDR